MELSVIAHLLLLCIEDSTFLWINAIDITFFNGMFAADYIARHMHRISLLVNVMSCCRLCSLFFHLSRKRLCCFCTLRTKIFRSCHWHVLLFGRIDWMFGSAMAEELDWGWHYAKEELPFGRTPLYTPYILCCIHQDLELVPCIASLQYAVPLPPCVLISIHCSRLNRPCATEVASLTHFFFFYKACIFVFVQV